MKKKVTLVVVIIALSILAMAGKPEKYKIYNKWSDIQLSKAPIVSNADSTIILISNRHFAPKDTAFFKSYRDSQEQIKTVIAQFIDGVWQVHEVNNLQQALSYLPKRDIVFYTEGMGKTFPLNLKRGVALTTQYEVNVVMFDYPSIDPERSWFTNFNFAYAQAEEAVVTYSKFLNEVESTIASSPDKFQGITTSLFHHSMGNIMVKELVEQGLHKQFDNLHLDRIVLNAACVPGKDHQKWVSQLSFADEVVINYNEEDRQLNGASIITFNKMLGIKIDHPLANNAIYVDMNPSLGKTHSAYLDIKGRDAISPHIKDYYSSLFSSRPSSDNLLLSMDDHTMQLNRP